MPTRPNGIASVGSRRRTRRSPKNNTRGKPPTYPKKNTRGMTLDELREALRKRVSSIKGSA